MPPEIFEKMKPDFVSPLVMYLCSEDCGESGKIFNAGMGYYNRAAVMTGPAVQLGDQDNPPTPEMIHENWETINAIDGGEEYKELNSAIFALISPPSAEAAEEDAARAESGSVAAIFENMSKTFKADAAAGVVWG